MDTELRVQVLAALIQDGVRVEAVPQGDERLQLQAMEAFVTHTIGYLHTEFPNERIRDLMHHVWCYVGVRKAQFAAGPMVPSLSFAATQHKALVLMPHHWLKLIERDLVMQTAALVFTGAQVVDFNNKKLGPRTGERALAYEAEFLLTMRKTEPGWAPNEYQEDILEKYPQGLDTPGVQDMLYARAEPPSHLPYKKDSCEG
jgi:hypothetical protein